VTVNIVLLLLLTYRILFPLLSTITIVSAFYIPQSRETTINLNKFDNKLLFTVLITRLVMIWRVVDGTRRVDRVKGGREESQARPEEYCAMFPPDYGGNWKRFTIFFSLCNRYIFNFLKITQYFCLLKYLRRCIVTSYILESGVIILFLCCVFWVRIYCDFYA
jgi:hypothetical protein